MESVYLTAFFSFIDLNSEILFRTWIVFSFLTMILTFIYDDFRYHKKMDENSEYISHHNKVMPKGILIVSVILLLTGLLGLSLLKIIAFFYFL